jgi:hypothetical protein
MKAFKCDCNTFYGVCYLDILKRTKYLNLVVANSKIIDVDIDDQCDECNNFFSTKESLNSFKHIIKILEDNKC